MVELAKRYYEGDDNRVLPRVIANKTAFENAMSLDIAMGGSTNTVLHLLAAAQEGEVDFTMRDIDRLSRRIPTLCKVAPASHFHMEDVHRAGGVMAILGELDRAKLIDTAVPTIHSWTLAEALEPGTSLATVQPRSRQFYRARGRRAFRHSRHSRSRAAIRSWISIAPAELHSLDLSARISQDGRARGALREHRERGCIVKTAGVDEKLLRPSARTGGDLREPGCGGRRILGGKVKAGDAVIVRYEGPRGEPGMQEMLYPTSYLKSKGLAKSCALITDSRFSRGSSGCSIGHVSPELPRGAARSG